MNNDLNTCNDSRENTKASDGVMAPPTYSIERELKSLHDKVCQTCDGCSKTRCAFTEGFRRGAKETKERNLEEQLNLHTSRELLGVLQHYAGERGRTEGAIETLVRIIRERDILLRGAVNDMLK